MAQKKLIPGHEKMSNGSGYAQKINLLNAFHFSIIIIMLCTGAFLQIICIIIARLP
jgi:hypothetical protein